MCEVIDLRTIRPLDYNDTIFESVKKTNRLVILRGVMAFWEYFYRDQIPGTESNISII